MSLVRIIFIGLFLLLIVGIAISERSQVKLTSFSPWEQLLDQQRKSKEKIPDKDISTVLQEVGTAKPMMSNNPCDAVSLADLNGVPNFPELDELVVCSGPDTMALLIYNNGADTLETVQITINYDLGLSYGGFVSSNYPDATVGELDVTDVINPVFAVSNIPPNGSVVANIAIQADCNIDLEGGPVNFDAQLSFSTLDGNGSPISCTKALTEVGEYNNSIKVPVINVLSVSPQELTLTQSNVARCQTIEISQDGLGAFVDEFTFETVGLDTANYTVTSFSVNGGAYPFSYDDGTQTISALISGAAFNGNTGGGANNDAFFNESERLAVEICYSVEGCISGGAADLDFQGYYGCNGDVCFAVSRKDGAVAFVPSYGASPVVASGNVQYGEICGQNLSFELDITSANTDPIDGLWNSLQFKYDACILDNTEVVDLQINGNTLDTAYWSIDGLTLVIDLRGLTTDIDGPGGLEDLDQDGFFDDLPGGNRIMLRSELAIGCAESLNCGDLECDLRRIEVIGQRNCSQPFQQFATFDPIRFYYGKESASTNAIPFLGYGIPITEVVRTTANVWAPTDSAYEFSYNFGSENIGACPNPGGIELVVNVVANGKRITDIRYTDNSATYQGAPVSGVTWQYDTVSVGGGNPPDTSSLTITIPAGDPNVNLHDYGFNLDFRGDCYPNDYMYLSYSVVEECNSCTSTGPCRIVRACETASSYVDWNGLACDCDIRGFMDTIMRTNYGYTDKTMTTRLTADQVPEPDRTRFLPGDTMYYRAGFEIVNAEVFYNSNYLWSFYVNPREDAGPVMLDVYNSTFGGWFYEDGATGQITEIGIPDCFQNYPDSTRDYYWEPSIGLWNMGVDNLSYSWVNRNNDAYLTCVNDDNVNPNYPPESAINYESRDDSSSDQFTDRQRIYIRWGRPRDCGNNLVNGNTDADGAQDSWMNNCHQQFLEQFPLKDGDIIYFDITSPVVHNPAFDLKQLNGTTLPGDNSFLRAHADVYAIDETTCGGTSTGISSLVASSCDDSTPYEGHLPGPVVIEPEVTVEDCDVEVNYLFTLENPTPPVDTANGELPWYQNEYRPYMATEYLELRFPSNMAFLGNSQIYLPNGDSTGIDAQYVDDSYGNLTCVDNGAGNVCCVPADGSMLGSMRIVDNDFLRGLEILSASDPELAGTPGYSTDLCESSPLAHFAGDPFPHIPVGYGDTCNYYGLRYDLTAICPEEVESTDFEILTQFSEPYIPNLVGRNGGTYRGSYQNSAGVEFVNSYRNLFEINPFGTDCQNEGIDDGCVAFYDRIFPHPIGSPAASNPMRQNDTLPTTPDNFTDLSQDYPPLFTISDNFMILIPDAEGASETNQYEVCTGAGPGATHTNVITNIFVPSAVEFLGATDENGTPYTVTQANTTPLGANYSISLPDMPPNTCYTIITETELLFCPVGLDLNTEVCLTTISGCLDPQKAADILASGGGSCSGTGNCFQYVAEEAEIQAEWDINPAGLNGLCDTIDFGCVIKNVRVSTLTDIDAEWYLPAGMEFVPGSWEVAYPGGPNNMATAVSIPDPIADPSKNSVKGEYFSYMDAGVWSQSVNTMGLPGINSGADSNFVAFRFKAITVCDDFVSGTSPWFQANGADPCEARVNSMLVDSEPLVITNANPFDFPQFFVFAEPLDFYCGVTDTVELTYLNIAPFGETQDAEVCIDLNLSELSYAANSTIMISPSSFNPNFTEVQEGSVIKICGAVPDGIGPGQAFRVGVPLTLPPSTFCGSGEIGVGVSSTVMDQSCSAPPQVCDVGVLNSVNPTVQVNFLPPIQVTQHMLSAACDNDPDNVTFDYNVSLFNGGATYSDDIHFEIVRDLNLNGMLDEGIDPVLASETRNLTLSQGDTLMEMGQLTVSAAEACPVFLRIRQTTGCQCDEVAYPYTSFEPTFSIDLQDEVVLCPDSRFGIEVCGDFAVTFEPAEGVTTTSANNGDSLYIEINEGFGLDNPVSMFVESQLGGCNAQTYQTKFFSLDGYVVGDYDTLTMCNVGCREIRIDLEGGFENYATVEWTPNLYLDDNTSFSPTVCDPQQNITYTVTVTIDAGGEQCQFTGTYPIEVEQQQSFDVVDNAYDCNNDRSRFEGPGGYTNYVFYRQNADGSSTIVQAGNDSTYVGTVLGEYYLEFYNIGDICKNVSLPFFFEPCVDVALRKTLDSTATNFPIRVGQDVTFEIMVFNQETPELYNIEVADYFPVASLQLNDPQWQVTGPGVAEYIGAAFNTPLAGGDSIQLFVTFTVLPGVEGDLTNYAEVIRFDNDDDPTNGFPEDNDSVADNDPDNDPGGQPESDADDEVNGNGTGGVGDGDAQGDEDDHDPEVFTVVALDLGDLADSGAGTSSGNYETLFANNGPAHIIVPGLYLGDTVDVDVDGAPSTLATGDDSDDNLDDEDGLTIGEELNIQPGGTIRLPLSATNTTGSTAHLDVWIDWNGDGDFDDPNEQVANLDDASGTFPAFLTVNVPADAAQDQGLGVRIRLSNEDGLTPNGLSNSGEIEDYLITVTCTTPACLPIGTQK